jgi:hypothetical protein
MSRHRGPWVLAVLSLLGNVSPLRAQVTAPVGPGAIVRSRDRSDSYSNEGTIIWIRSDSLRVSMGASAVTMALAAHPELEVRGARGDRGRGALIGLGAGAAFGVGLGVLAGGCSPDQFCVVSRGKAAGVFGGLFGVVGAVIGACVTPGYNWKPLRPGQVIGAVQIRPMMMWSHGPALGVSVRF